MVCSTIQVYTGPLTAGYPLSDGSAALIGSYIPIERWVGSDPVFPIG
jgi:hypothetical protein